MLWSFHLENGPPRVNHASVAVGDKIYSFGGYCSELQFSLYIDIHCFDTSSLQWSKVYYDSNINTPKGCYGHTVVLFEDLIYLWGGQNSFSASNTLYCFDPWTCTWSEPATTGQLPSAADGHSACVIGHHMYVFGGFEEETESFSNKVHRINLRTFVWELVQSSGVTPSRRDFHTASVIGQRMYVFGGRCSSTGDEDSEYYSRNIKYLDTMENTWVVPATKGLSPSGRRSHSAVVYKDEIYIIGGYEGRTGFHLNDVFKFNPVSNEWVEKRVLGKGPKGRRRHNAAVVGDQLYLFGGSSPSPVHYSMEHETGLQEHSDLYVLDFFPTLKRLCQVKIIETDQDFSCLPYILQSELLAMVSWSRKLSFREVDSVAT